MGRAVSPRIHSHAKREGYFAKLPPDVSMRFFPLAATVMAIALASSARAQDTASAPIDTSYVVYHDSPITLPLGIGLRVPTYDRVNGLTVPWGPRLRFGEDRF